uniref:F-box domain-containing protein n=1 Tax=Anopheles dirus TaxID=7168 RepID=A0A182N173_9DIPT
MGVGPGDPPALSQAQAVRQPAAGVFVRNAAARMQAEANMDHNIPRVPGEICQFVDTVQDATSEYGGDMDLSYMAINLVGRPQRFPQYGDHSDSYLLPSYGRWAQEAPSYAPEFGTANLSARDNPPVHDFVTVTFEKPVYPSLIMLFETYNPSAVFRIWASVDVDWWVLLWDVRDQPAEPAVQPDHARILYVTPPPIRRRTYVLRVEFSAGHLPYLTGLEAIMMRGNPHFPIEPDPFRPRAVPPAEPAEPAVPAAASAGQVRITDLPDECLLQIFSTLDLPTLRVVDQVCRRFRSIASDSQLYREVNFRQCWMKTDSDLLNFVKDRCTRICKLDLSWCGSSRSITTRDVFDFLDRHGRKLTHLYMNAASIEYRALCCIDVICPNLLELCLRNATIQHSWSPSYWTLLTRLDLSHTHVNTETLDALLRKNPALQHLAVNCCPALEMGHVTATLGTTNHALVTFNAHKTNMWETGLEPLTACTALQELDISWGFANDSLHDALGLLLAKWPLLKRLAIGGMRSVSSEDVAAVARCCPALEQLDIMGCIRVEQWAVEQVLERCNRLRLMDLTYCSSIRRDWVITARQRYPNLCLQFMGTTMSSKISKIVQLSPAENHPVIMENFGTYLAHRQHDMKGLLARDQSDRTVATLGGSVANVLMVTGERQLYYGRVDDQQDEPEQLRTYVARRNRTTGKMRLVEVRSCRLAHISQAETYATGAEPDVALDPRRVSKLQQKFNSRAGRKAQNRQNQRPDLTTMDDKLRRALAETVVKQPEAEQAAADEDAGTGVIGDDLQQELQARASPAAKTLADLYRAERVIGEDVWQALTAPATTLLQQQPAEELQMMNAYLETRVKAAMQAVRADQPPPEPELAVVRTCLYMDVLARLFSPQAYKLVHGNRRVSPFTRALDNPIWHGFLQTVRNASSTRNQVTKYTRSKALMHYLALVFALEARPTVDIGTLLRATEVKRADLLMYGRLIGAQYVTREDYFRLAPVRVSQGPTQSERVQNMLAALKASYGLGKRKKK